MEKSEKWSKFGQKLHEFERIRAIFCIFEKYFSKIVNWGGRNKLKCLEKNPNFGNYPPPHNYGGESIVTPLCTTLVFLIVGGVIFRKSDFLPPNPAYHDPPFYENNFMTSLDFPEFFKTFLIRPNLHSLGANSDFFHHFSQPPHFIMTPLFLQFEKRLTPPPP